MQIESCLRQQRSQFERSEAVSRNFRVAIKTGLTIDGLVPSIEVIEVLLCLLDVGTMVLGSGYDRFSGVRSHQLGPVFLQKIGAGKDVSPYDLAVYRNHHAYRILIA